MIISGYITSDHYTKKNHRGSSSSTTEKSKVREAFTQVESTIISSAAAVSENTGRAVLYKFFYYDCDSFHDEISKAKTYGTFEKKLRPLTEEERKRFNVGDHKLI